MRQEMRSSPQKLKQSLLENLQHNITQDDGSIGTERALSFKAVRTVEIKMEMVDDQWLNLKMRGNPCAHTSQPIEYELACHIRQKSHKPFLLFVK